MVEPLTPEATKLLVAEEVRKALGQQLSDKAKEQISIDRSLLSSHVRERLHGELKETFDDIHLQLSCVRSRIELLERQESLSHRSRSPEPSEVDSERGLILPAHRARWRRPSKPVSDLAVKVSDLIVTLDLSDQENGLPAADGELPHVPETLFGYCVLRLCSSSRPFADQAFAKLLLLITVQTTMMFGFYSAQMQLMYRRYWLEKQHHSSERHFRTCLSEPVVALHAQPALDLCCSFFALLLVAFGVRAQDIDTLNVVYPMRMTGHCVRWLVNYAWFIQAIFLPNMFIVAAGYMLAMASSPQEVAFNALGLSFMLEIDDMMYSGFTSAEDRAVYLQLSRNLAGLHHGDAEKYSPWLLLLEVSGLYAMYATFNLAVILNFRGDDYLMYSMYVAVPVAAAIWGARGLALHHVMQYRNVFAVRETNCGSFLGYCRGMLSSLICTGVLYFLLQYLFVPQGAALDHEKWAHCEAVSNISSAMGHKTNMKHVIER